MIVDIKNPEGKTKLTQPDHKRITGSKIISTG